MNKFILKIWMLVLFGGAMLFGVTSPAQAKEPPMQFGFCSPGQAQAGLLCHEKCASGNTDVLGVCWQNCPAKFTDIGAFCSDLDIKTKATQERGAGVALWCRPGTEQNGALCYPPCTNNHYGVGPVCWEYCPPGTDTDMGAVCVRWPKILRWAGWWIFKYAVMDWGWWHWKHTYRRGAGEVLSHCRPGTEKSGALCYPACKSGFEGVGPVCWQKCPTGYTNDGAFCRRDNGFAKKSYVAKVTGAINRCPDYPKDTKYPIVLVHGLFGFDKLFGVAPYFNQIPECLRAGGATVYTPAISAGNSTEVRGEQLLAHVREVLKETGKEKVHLIGHSHGGPTSRYVAGVAPELVASVTTVGGVNHGSHVADLMLKILPDGNGAQTVVGGLFDAINYLTAFLSGKSVLELPQDTVAATRSLSKAGSETFNAKFPGGLTAPGKSLATPLGSVEKDGTSYPMLFFSWTGNAPFGDLGIGPAVMRDMNLAVFLPQGVNSDGLVSVDSAHFGYFLGAYNHDHISEVNMWLNIPTALVTGRAHPVTLFAEHAYRLKGLEKTMDAMKPTPVVKQQSK
jgi:triacylglycerol lipase